jgi:hypothetical protein
MTSNNAFTSVFEYSVAGEPKLFMTIHYTSMKESIPSVDINLFDLTDGEIESMNPETSFEQIPFA